VTVDTSRLKGIGAIVAAGSSPGQEPQNKGSRKLPGWRYFIGGDRDGFGLNNFRRETKVFIRREQFGFDKAMRRGESRERRPSMPIQRVPASTV
jgi:hypothetical protein